MGLEEVEWEECLLELRRDPQLEREITRQGGRVQGSAHYFGAIPWFVRAIAELQRSSFSSFSLPDRMVDQIGLLVSRDNSCRYCFAYQRLILRTLGIPEDWIQRAEDDLLLAQMSREHRALLDFARAISRANPLPTVDQLGDLAELGVERLQVQESAAAAAFMIFFNRVSTIPALPPGRAESLPDRFVVRLLRPIAARYARRIIGRWKPRTALPVESGGVFASVVGGLAGLPHASALRGALDGMVASDVLPTRTKALIFAVVARGVGSEVTEAEARRWCAAGGMEAAQIDSALAHLADPALDAVESLALPLARDSVRYQPADIQRKARTLRDAVTEVQFAELIATVSLANAVTRLGMLAVPT